jgi:D-alanyl-D-alanine carboxypeptidase-like protein
MSLLARFGRHTLAIAIVGAALFGATLSRPANAVQNLAEVDAPATPTDVTLDLAALPVPPLATPRPETQTVTFDPHVGLPQWLRALRDVTLWSAADMSASATATLPALTTYVKPLGPFTDTRLEVYFPGDEDRTAAQGWIDTASLEPSGIPPWIAPTPDAGLPAPPVRTGEAPAPDTTAIHIAIVDDASGELMYGEQPYTEVAQASTTKIATTIVALERSPDLSQRINVTVSASAMVARDGSSTMGIEPGHSVSLDTLLHGMMLPSGNDAAEQVAVSLGGSRDKYIDWMNQEAASLGLKDTHFANPSGMDAAGHYSSAYDMAMLARYAMRNSTFRDLAAAETYSGDGFRMANLNRLLGVYPGADGVKIGFTDAAQKTIVASAVHNGHRVYVSLMHSEDLPGDCTLLFNWVWNSFAW